MNLWFYEALGCNDYETEIFSSFLKAKYILIDAQASIQLITSLTSHVCSGHFSHIDYAAQNLHPDLFTGFIIYSFTKHKRINERHSVKYCEMMGQINFALKATLLISLSTGSYIIYDYYSYWYILHIALHIVTYTENLDRLFYEGLQIFFKFIRFLNSKFV